LIKAFNFSLHGTDHCTGCDKTPILTLATLKSIHFDSFIYSFIHLKSPSLSKLVLKVFKIEAPSQFWETGLHFQIHQTAKLKYLEIYETVFGGRTKINGIAFWF